MAPDWDHQQISNTKTHSQTQPLREVYAKNTQLSVLSPVASALMKQNKNTMSHLAANSSRAETSETAVSITPNSVDELPLIVCGYSHVTKHKTEDVGTCEHKQNKPETKVALNRIPSYLPTFLPHVFVCGAAINPTVNVSLNV